MQTSPISFAFPREAKEIGDVCTQATLQVVRTSFQFHLRECMGSSFPPPPAKEQPGSIKCSRARCNTCPFMQNTVNISGPKPLIKINDRFDWTSTNIIYYITCNLCKMLYIGETGRRLGDRFREHLRDKDASKLVSKHFNLPGHSFNNMTVCGLSLHHQGNTKNRKNSE